MFLHVNANNDENDLEIVNIQKQNKSIVQKLEAIENTLSELDAKIVKSEDIITKLENIEKKFEKFTTMEQQLCKQDLIISTLYNKVNDLETNLANNVEKVEKLSEKVQSVAVKKLKCQRCEFETTSKQGLKVHMSRKHTKIEEIFPITCFICEDVLKNNEEKKKHIRKHSYKKAGFRCVECQFIGSTKLYGCAFRKVSFKEI